MCDKYEIVEGMRPDNVAQELYESDQFDWVVLLIAGITNVRNEWPLSNRDLYHYAHDKYGDSLTRNGMVDMQSDEDIEYLFSEMNGFMRKMKASGYSVDQRREVLECGVKGYYRMVRN